MIKKVMIKTLMTAALMGFILSGTLFAQGSAEAEKGLPDYTQPEALRELIEQQTEEYLLLDVRTPAEFSQGHIPTAVNLPLSDIPENPPALESDALIIVYCRSGNRSASAQKLLEGLGYTRVLDFGGLSRWPHEQSR